MSANLTPVEIIKLGMEQGHSPDVILASLEAGGWVCVPRKATNEMVLAACGVDFGGETFLHFRADAHDVWGAMLAARPK